MNKKQKIDSGIIILIVAIIIGIGLIIVNLFIVKNGDFLKSSLIDIIALVIVGIFVFYLSERKSDKRRKYDCVEHIIIEIQNILESGEYYSNNKLALIRQTSCANKIKYIIDANIQEIEEDIIFIDTHFQEIRNLYSNHQQDLDSVRSDIDRHQILICDKCDKIRINLYK